MKEYDVNSPFACASYRNQPIKISTIIGLILLLIPMFYILIFILPFFGKTPDIDVMRQSLLERELPPDTAIIEEKQVDGVILGAPGRTFGYYATALIKTSLSEDELKDFYYAKYRKLGLEPDDNIMEITPLSSLKEEFGIYEYVVLVRKPQNGRFPSFDFELYYDALSGGVSDEGYYIICVYDSWTYPY